MPIIQCSECSGKVSTTLNVCPHCGFHFNQAQVQSRPKPPPLPGQPKEPIVGGRGKIGSGPLGGRRIKPRQTQRVYPVPTKSPNNYWVGAALVVVGGVIVLLLAVTSRPKSSPEAASRPKVSSLSARPGGGKSTSAPVRGRYPAKASSYQEEAESVEVEAAEPSEVGEAESVEEILERKQIVELPPPSDEDSEIEGFDFGVGDFELELEKESSEGQGESHTKFLEGMALFDSGEYTKLSSLFQTMVSEDRRFDSESERTLKGKIELWILWADFLAAVEGVVLNSAEGAVGKEGPKDGYIKLILANGREIEGELVSEDSEKVVVKSGSIRSTHLEADIKKKIIGRKAKPATESKIAAESLNKGPQRSLEEISAEIKSLTLDEVLSLVRKGVKKDSREGVALILKKVPEEFPSFVTSLFKTIAEKKDRKLIVGLNFNTPDLHLELARECKSGGLAEEFRRHRHRYLVLLGNLSSEESTLPECKDCKGARLRVCKSCRGDGLDCTKCDQDGLSLCVECAESDRLDKVEAGAPGPVFTGDFKEVCMQLRSLEKSRGKLTSFQYEQQQIEIWEEHAEKWLFCIGRIESVIRGYDGARIRVTYLDVKKDWNYKRLAYLTTKNLQFAEKIGKGDYIRLWVQISRYVGELSLHSAVPVYSGPFKTFRTAASKGRR